MAVRGATAASGMGRQPDEAQADASEEVTGHDVAGPVPAQIDAARAHQEDVGEQGKLPDDARRAQPGLPGDPPDGHTGQNDAAGGATAEERAVVTGRAVD